MFGAEAGRALFLEAESEFNFMTDNIISNVMEPLDSEFLNPEQRLKAKKNARDIQKQIMKLIRIFGTKQMQDKLEKEIKIPRSTNNDVSNYLEVFRDLKKLWTSKLCTPLEEVQSIREQLQRLEMSVNDLQTTLKSKDESYSKYLEQSKEHKTQLTKEADTLTQLKNSKISLETSNQLKYTEQGKITAQKKEEEHKACKVELNKRIALLEKELAEAKKQNTEDELKLTSAFQQADRTYVDALLSYDTDMKQHEEQLEMAQNALKEKEHERNQL